MNDTERNKAHVKLLLDAAMSAACEEYNPRLEKAFANLTAFQSHIDRTIQQHGGWQPGILQALLDNLSLDHFEDELGEFSYEHMKQLKKMVQACLDKGIDQQTVYRALEEYVEEERKEIEQIHGVRLE